MTLRSNSRPARFVRRSRHHQQPQHERSDDLVQQQPGPAAAHHRTGAGGADHEDGGRPPRRSGVPGGGQPDQPRVGQDLDEQSAQHQVSRRVAPSGPAGLAGDPVAGDGRDQGSSPRRRDWPGARAGGGAARLWPRRPAATPRAGSLLDRGLGRPGLDRRTRGRRRSGDALFGGNRLRPRPARPGVTRSSGDRPQVARPGAAWPRSVPRSRSALPLPSV